MGDWNAANGTVTLRPGDLLITVKLVEPDKTTLHSHIRTRPAEWVFEEGAEQAWTLAAVDTAVVQAVTHHLRRQGVDVVVDVTSHAYSEPPDEPL